MFAGIYLLLFGVYACRQILRHVYLYLRMRLGPTCTRTTVIKFKNPVGKPVSRKTSMRLKQSEIPRSVFFSLVPGDQRVCHKANCDLYRLYSSALTNGRHDTTKLPPHPVHVPGDSVWLEGCPAHCLPCLSLYTLLFSFLWCLFSA